MLIKGKFHRHKPRPHPVRMQRTRKHLSKKEKFLATANPNFTLVREAGDMPTSESKAQVIRFASAVPHSEREGLELVSVKDAPLLLNALIDRGEGYVEHAVRVLQCLHAQLGSNKTFYICSLCAKRIGVKRCAQCPSTSTVRYCSRRCQVAAWPQHKACCGEQKVIDVE